MRDAMIHPCQSKRRWKLAYAAVATWCIVTIFNSAKLIFRGKGDDLEAKDQDSHSLKPTLLSVVYGDGTKRYVSAHKNPLYTNLKNGVFLPDNEQEDVLESPTIQVDPAEINLREQLRLTWTLGRTKMGKTVVDDNDVIILYCREQIGDFKNGKFLDAATLAQAKATSKKHFLEGGGDLDGIGNTTWYFPHFPVVRCELCRFELYKALPRNRFALLASAEQHIRDGMTAPTAIHLALGNDHDEMVVQFQTGSHGGHPIVQYGIAKDSMLLSASGTSHTYSAKDMCQEPATEEGVGKFIDPGQLHVVRLTHLEPSTTYHYKVGVEDHGTTTTWSETFSFVSAPHVEANANPWSYIVYGDQGCPSVGWGQGGVWTAAMASREVEGGPSSLPIRAVHHFGDLSYARGAGHIWDEWLNMISPFTTRVPLMVSVGNHEYDHTKGGENGKDPSGVPTPDGYRPKWGNFRQDSGGECGVPTSKHFQMPKSGNSNGVFWYSFDYGNVHTTVISAEHDLSPGSDQYRWLEGDLKGVDRAKLPWLVLELHRPLYESLADPFNKLVGISIRKRIEDLLKQYQVDLVLAGHYHSYQRSCSGLYNSKCNSGGPTHLTIGTGGAKLKKIHYPSGAKWTSKIIVGQFGYGRITVANATALHFEFLEAGGPTDKNVGKVLDETWLLKHPSVVEGGHPNSEVDSEAPI